MERVDQCIAGDTRFYSIHDGSRGTFRAQIGQKVCITFLLTLSFDISNHTDSKRYTLIITCNHLLLSPSDLISKYGEDTTSPANSVRTFLGTMARQNGTTFYRMSSPRPSAIMAITDVTSEFSQEPELYRISLGEEDEIKIDVTYPLRVYSAETQELRSVGSCAAKEPEVMEDRGRDQRTPYYAEL